MKIDLSDLYKSAQDIIKHRILLKSHITLEEDCEEKGCIK